VTGEVEGATLRMPFDLETLQTIKENVRLTLDINDGKGASLRAKLQARIVDGREYVLIESVEGTYDHELAAIAASLKAKKWMMISFEDLEDMLMTPQMEEATTASWEELREFMDGAFDLTKNGMSYSLMVKPDVLNAIKADGDIDDMNVHVKIDTNANDTLKAVKFYAAATAQEDMHRFTGVIQGSFTPRTKPVTVQVPAGAVDMQEYLESFGMPFLPSSFQDSSDAWEDTTSTIDEYNDSDCDPSTSKGLSNIRKGACGSFKNSNR
jgi:hypothetical protein